MLLKNQCKINSVKLIEIILDRLFRILHGWYQPMQLYLRAGFSLPAQASFFLICTGDSTDADYRLHIIPRPEVLYFIFYFKKIRYNLQKINKSDEPTCSANKLTAGESTQLFKPEMACFGSKLSHKTKSHS